MKKFKYLIYYYVFPLKSTFISIIIGLLVGAIVIGLSGSNPIDGIVGLIQGGFGSTHAITTTLTRSIPIIFAGLSASLAWGSGYSSMGASGQMVLGALAAGVVAVSIPGPIYLVLFIALVVGVIVGMLYSLVATFISHKFEVNLLITTLMLNYIADNIASYLTTYVFRDPFASDRLAVQTQKIEGSILTRIFPGYTLHYGFIIAIIVTIIVLFVMKRTTFGYKMKMGGLNARFAKYGGVKATSMMYLTLLFSGALAGLGGAVEVLGTRYRYVDKMITSPGFAWSGITASLMAANNPLGVFISAVFLAGLTTGGSYIELKMGIPSEITILIQGVLTMLVTARFAIKYYKKQQIKEVI